jgi:hypothetical protein
LNKASGIFAGLALSFALMHGAAASAPKHPDAVCTALAAKIGLTTSDPDVAGNGDKLHTMHTMGCWEMPGGFAPDYVTNANTACNLTAYAMLKAGKSAGYIVRDQAVNGCKQYSDGTYYRS